jgi:hypothetical protein
MAGLKFRVIKNKILGKILDAGENNNKRLGKTELRTSRFVFIILHH